MEQRLVPHGDGFALPIARDLLDLLEVGDEAAFTVAVTDGALVVTPVATGTVEPTIEEAVQRRAQFEAALARINERFAGALSQLGAGA
jgi:hypothetical protein